MKFFYVAYRENAAFSSLCKRTFNVDLRLFQANRNLQLKRKTRLEIGSFSQFNRLSQVVGSVTKLSDFCLQKQPKTLVTFWAILKSITLCKNCCSIYLVNFWKHLGYNFTPISGRTGCRSRSSQNSIKDWFHGSNTVIWQILLTINFFKEAEIVSTFKKQKKFLPILIFKVQIFIRYPQISYQTQQKCFQRWCRKSANQCDQVWRNFKIVWPFL